MAQPSNDHHVHSDGYYSDRGEPDRERMLVELSDEVEQLPGVDSVVTESDLAGPYIEVVFEDEGVVVSVEELAQEWSCDVTSVGDDWLEVRPE